MAKRAKSRGKSKTNKTKQRESVFAKFSLFFYSRPRLSLVLWVELIIAGVLSFSVLLPKEGFPPVQFPIGVASGTYFVDDASKVDQDVTKKISDAVVGVDGIEQLDTVASNNFFQVIASYSDDMTSESGNELLRQTIEEANVLPETASIQYTVIDPSKFLNEYDALISVYAKEGQSASQLEQQAGEIAKKLSLPEGVSSAEVVSQFEEGINPLTGEEVVQQTTFGGVGIENDDGGADLYRSVVIGVNRSEGVDIIDLSNIINGQLEEVENDQNYSAVGVVIGADFAESINTQIDGLMQNLLTGLIAVAIVSFLLITWRASIITAAFMVTVILSTMFILFLLGFTLNTITLFGLVLSLGLFVDDATIIVEAIDAGRKSSKKSRDVVKNAVAKVASASFAGTMTTVLVFLPLAFIIGILGEFIRILPLTVITALVVSIVLSLSLIPFLSRFVLLRNMTSKPKKVTINPISALEKFLASCLEGFINLTKRGKAWRYGLTSFMIVFSLFFIFASGALAAQLKFNIFPPTKDADQLNVEISYPNGTTIDQAEQISVEIGEIVNESIGDNVIKMNVGAFQPASNRSADILIELVPYTDREVKSPELIADVQSALDGYDQASTRVIQIDAGPPAEQFPFKTQIYSEDRAEAIAGAKDVQEFLSGSTVERQNGTTAEVADTRINYSEDIARRDGRQFVQTEAGFSEADVTALVVAAQEQVEAEYTPERLTELGLEDDAIEFNFGFESDSQESFSSLPLIGMIALAAMFVLLAIQFRSLLQPLLIFMAIPFSFFGVMLGLNITNNPISFFAMIGFFGLIGISVNNTILMTDYANQERREGKRIIDSISSAARKRFRPLLTTSITTVAALTPLALTDPFWESLAFTIIFGLLSSTFFVLVSFPFYYMVAEGLRSGARNKWRKLMGRA